MNTWLIPLFIVLLAAQQCPIPPNCQTYSTSLQRCTACQQNFLLFSNMCISIQTLTSLLNNQQNTLPATTTTTNTFTSPSQNIVNIPSTTSNVPTTSFTTTSNTPSATTTRTNTSSQTPQTGFVPWNTPQTIPVPTVTPTRTTTTTTINPTVIQTPSQTQFGFAQGSSQSSSFQSSWNDREDYNCNVTDINNICIQCYRFFYIDASGRCVPADPQCRTYTLDQSLCTSCYLGYTLNNGKCDKTQSNIGASSNGQQRTTSNVQSSSSTTSTSSSSSANTPTASSGSSTQTASTGSSTQTASTGSSTQTSQSSQSSQTSQSSQSSASQAGGQYVTWNGLIYLINAQGQAIGPLNSIPSASSNPPRVDPNCQIYSNGVCTTCNVRYNLLNGICTLRQPNCNRWTANGICQQCRIGFTLANGSCQQTLVQSNQAQSICHPREVLINGLCVGVSDLCATWSNTTAACTLCYRGYRLVNGACQLL